MKPAREEVTKVVAALSEVVPFFPKEAFALELIVESLLEFVGGQPQLDWFARAAVRTLSRYQGVPQLRALYCSNWAPADGILPTVDLEGLSSDRLEADFQRRVMEENEARFAVYCRQSALAPPEDREPLQLPGMPLKHIEAPVPLVCRWCALGFARVHSSIDPRLAWFPSSSVLRHEVFVHPDTEVGRVVCKVSGGVSRPSTRAVSESATAETLPRLRRRLRRRSPIVGAHTATAAIPATDVPTESASDVVDQANVLEELVAHQLDRPFEGEAQ